MAVKGIYLIKTAANITPFDANEIRDRFLVWSRYPNRGPLILGHGSHLYERLGPWWTTGDDALPPRWVHVCCDRDPQTVELVDGTTLEIPQP